MALSIKELMIDDIVLAEEYYIDDNTDEEVSIMHPARVTDISPNCLLWMDGRECVISIDWLDDCSSESTGEIKPMPLTKEILKANGFILRNKTSSEDNDIYYKCYVDSDNKAYEIHYRPYDGQLRLFWVNTIFGIKYVHQLQQLLRICGLKKISKQFQG